MFVLAFFRSLVAAPLYALDRYAENWGMAIAAKIPMIATTIKSSIKVNPLSVIDNFPIFNISPRT